MKKLILILSLLPLLVLNIAPMGFTVTELASGEMHEFPVTDANNSNKNSDRSMLSEYLETLSEAEAEEKVISVHNYNNPYIASQYGYALKDQFAIPNERSYLPDEPPTV